MSETGKVTVERIDPFEEPGSYGGAALLNDLTNIQHVSGDGPVIDQDLVNALERGEYDRADQLLDPVRDWLKRRDYTVLDEGTVPTPVPFLVAQAPDVAGISVEASQETVGSHGGEFSFTVFGNGLGANAKVSVGSTSTLTAKTKEALVYSVVLPIHWERRADPRNEDINWIVTEVARSSETTIRAGAGEIPDGIRVLDSIVFDNTNGGAEPFTLGKSYAVEVGSDFTVGLKVDTLGIDTSLKISTTESSTTTLAASLPSGHVYEISWLGGPWGARVTARG